MSQQGNGDQQDTADSQESGETRSSSQQHADTSGAETGKNGGDGGFKPIQSEAELSAWKDATRKEIVASVKKDVTADLKRKSDEESAKAKGEFETLAHQRQERIEELERSLAERDRNELRARVGRTHKLPDDLITMLQGEDEAALTESAKLLAKHIKPVAAADTEGGVGAGVTSSDTDHRPKKGVVDKEPAYTFDGKQKVPVETSHLSSSPPGIPQGGDMAAVTKGTLRPVHVPGYEVNDKGQAKVAISKGDLLIMTADTPNAGHERVWDKAPVSTVDPHGIALMDAPVNGTVNAGIMGEMDGFTALVPGALLYSSPSVVGGLDTTAVTNAIGRIRATTTTRIRYNFT